MLWNPNLPYLLYFTLQQGKEMYKEMKTYNISSAITSFIEEYFVLVKYFVKTKT